MLIYSGIEGQALTWLERSSIMQAGRLGWSRPLHYWRLYKPYCFLSNKFQTAKFLVVGSSALRHPAFHLQRMYN